MPLMYEVRSVAAKVKTASELKNRPSPIPGGHRSPLGALLDVAYVIEYGADSTEQSALNLIFLLCFQPNASSLSVFGESDEKFHVRGSNQQLPEAIARFLGADTVRLGHRLTRLAPGTGDASPHDRRKADAPSRLGDGRS